MFKDNKNTRTTKVNSKYTLFCVSIIDFEQVNISCIIGASLKITEVVSCTIQKKSCKIVSQE